MFIKSNINCRIRSNDNLSKFDIPKEWIGQVPEWVEENWYFQSLCQSGKITYINSNDSYSKIDTKVENSKDVETKQNKVAEEQRAFDEKVAQKVQEATDMGLGETEKKNYVKQELEKELDKKKKK